MLSDAIEHVSTPTLVPGGASIAYPRRPMAKDTGSTTGKKRNDPRDTPAMRQYFAFKKQYPDCILFFRMGDFYEMFDEDAVVAHRALGITLTERTKGMPMAGVPYHAVENYLRRMIEQGYRVAVCEQVQDPKEAKGVVDRDVQRVLTPGTLVDDSLLRDDAHNNLACVCFLDSGDEPDGRVAIAIVELSTGAFTLLDCAAREAIDELTRRGVNELVYADTADGVAPARVKRLLDALGVPGTGRPGWQFRRDEAMEALLTQYRVASLAGFGLGEDDAAVPAAGAILRYLHETQTPGGGGASGADGGSHVLGHLSAPKRELDTGALLIDAASLRALEIERTMRSGAGSAGQGADGSLLGVFARTGGCRTPMGRRLLRDWLCRPLGEKGAIEARQRCVATLVEDRRAAEGLGERVREVQDVARIAGRLGMGRATPRDLAALGRSLSKLEAIAEAIENAPAFAGHRKRLLSVRDALAPLAAVIESSCVERPPAHLREGGLFRDGVDAELDEARSLQRDGASWLAAYQQRLIEEHSLPGVKVGYNKVFGYYIELTQAQARHAPEAFTRKQTLKNAERYITPELKEFEEKVTTAEARAISREQKLFADLCARVGERLREAAAFGEAVAELDVLLCFAERAARKGWTKPEIVDEPVIDIVQGRHPALEEILGENFVPNDAQLGTGERPARLALITGPNMAGKSTYIRQTALLVTLAHTGSFVPAERATIGLADRVFTRIGADDALHAGQSTFMVEMTETANILHHATERSVIALDEIGRGTSTLDGLSLAWAIAESLAARKGTPRTMFATHYHELTELEERLPGRVTNLHVSVREWGEEIVFLHRILPGRTDRSYGIHVARLAGLPGAVVKRANELLESLSVSHGPGGGEAARGEGKRASAVSQQSAARDDGAQLGLFTEFLPHPVVDELKELKLDTMSPMEAFDALRRMRERVEE